MENKIEMANPGENGKVLLQNDKSHSGPTMPHGIEIPNIIFNEIQLDEQRELENDLSHFAVYDVPQYSSELDQNQRSLNHSQTNYGERSFSNISGESNLRNQNQPCAVDLRISKEDCCIYSTNNEIQNRNDVRPNLICNEIQADELKELENIVARVVHNVGECSSIRATNISQNSIYVHNDEQPSCSNDSNNNLYPIIPPKLLDKKRFPCQFCKKTYAAKNSLKKHLLIHTGEKRHLSTYYEEENFLCRICNKRFATKDYLLTHMLIHF